MDAFTTHTGTAPRCSAATSTPTRSSRPSTSSGSTRNGYEDGLFAAWRTEPDFVLNRPGNDGASIWSPARTSAPARRASTRTGRCMDGGFRVVIGSRFADMSGTTRARAGCSPSSDRGGRRGVVGRDGGGACGCR